MCSQCSHQQCPPTTFTFLPLWVLHLCFAADIGLKFITKGSRCFRLENYLQTVTWCLYRPAEWRSTSTERLWPRNTPETLAQMLESVTSPSELFSANAKVWLLPWPLSEVPSLIRGVEHSALVCCHCPLCLWQWHVWCVWSWAFLSRAPTARTFPSCLGSSDRSAVVQASKKQRNSIDTSSCILAFCSSLGLGWQAAVGLFPGGSRGACLPSSQVPPEIYN